MIIQFDQPAGRLDGKAGQDRQSGLFAHLGMTAITKVTAQASNGGLGLVEVSLSPHFRNMAPHWHRQTTEVIYVLDGTVAFTVGDATFTGTSGRVVIIQPCTVHHLWNPTALPATVLLIYTPGGFAAYFAELTVAGSTVPIKAEQLLAIAAQYDQFMSHV